MKAKEVHTLTDDQLRDQLIELRKEQMNLRFQQATAQLEKTARVGEVRKTIARLKTEMTARERTSAGE